MIRSSVVWVNWSIAVPASNFQISVKLCVSCVCWATSVIIALLLYVVAALLRRIAEASVRSSQLLSWDSVATVAEQQVAISWEGIAPEWLCISAFSFLLSCFCQQELRITERPCFVEAEHLADVLYATINYDWGPHTYYILTLSSITTTTHHTQKSFNCSSSIASWQLYVWLLCLTTLVNYSYNSA